MAFLGRRIFSNEILFIDSQRKHFQSEIDHVLIFEIVLK